MISANADYVNRYPVATKRVLRAILKAADLCVSDPAWVAGQLVERGFVPSYDYALQTLNDTRYDVWREYDAEASMRFYALRMHETGMIKSSPQTDHRQRHGLALPRRAEARAEDVSDRRHAVPFQGKERLMQIIQNRRHFLAGAAAAGAAGLLGTTTRARAEPPPETTSVRLPAFPKVSDCMTPIYISQDLLRAEGFTDISW